MCSFSPRLFYVCIIQPNKELLSTLVAMDELMESNEINMQIAVPVGSCNHIEAKTPQ